MGVTRRSPGRDVRDIVIFALGSTNSSVFKILWEEMRPFQVRGAIAVSQRQWQHAAFCQGLETSSSRV
jgi:hypothetical protein